MIFIGIGGGTVWLQNWKYGESLTLTIFSLTHKFKGPWIHKLDVLVIQESHIRHGHPAAVRNDIAPAGYSALHVHRDASAQNYRGGGLAVVHRHSIMIKSISVDVLPTTTEFEHQVVSVRFGSRSILLANIYRQPRSKPTAAFFRELSDFIAVLLSLTYKSILITVDFNCPGRTRRTVDDDLMGVFSSFGLTQGSDAW